MKERIKTIVFWILLAFTAAAAMVTPWACANKKENNSEKETMVESQEAAEGTIVGDGAGLNNVGFAKSLDGENVEKAQEQAERSIVRLDVQGNGAEYFGSGVIWDVTEEGIIIVTSRHLLEEGELLRVVLPDGRETFGKTEGLCQVKDIGFVVVPEDLPEKEKVNGASSDAAEKTMLVVSLHQRIFDTLDAESPLVVLGCSEDGVGDEARHAVLKDKAWFREEFGSDIMVLECEAKPGMSGGGVFDGNGNFVGMLGGGSGNDAAALSMETVNEAYEEVFGRMRSTEEY